MLKNISNQRKKLKLLIFFLLNKKIKKVDLLFFFFFFFKNNFFSFSPSFRTDIFFKKAIVTGLIPEEGSIETDENSDDFILYDNPCLKEYGLTFMPNVSKKNVVFNGPINFLRLKRGLLSKKRLAWNELLMAEYLDFDEGILDYKDPYFLNMYEFKLNSEGNYLLEQVEDQKIYKNNREDNLDDDEEYRTISLENEYKNLNNVNVKSFLFFFHKLPNLFYKNKKNKFFLLKRASYSRKLKNKIFKFLKTETGSHPISFLKNLLNVYKFNFDALEEEYLYSSFDSLKKLNTSFKENIVFLNIEGFFDEYKLNAFNNNDDKIEVINSTDDITMEKSLNTIVSESNLEKDNLKENTKSDKVDLDSLPYNFKIISINEPNIIEKKEIKIINKTEDFFDTSKPDDFFNINKGTEQNVINLEIKSQSFTENTTIKKKEENKENNTEELKNKKTSFSLMENLSFKLDLINEDWEVLTDTYKFFLFKKKNNIIKKKEYLNFFFYDLNSFFVFNELDTLPNETCINKWIHNDLNILSFDDLSFEQMPFINPTSESTVSDKNLIKNYISFLNDETLAEDNAELLESLNFNSLNFEDDLILNQEEVNYFFIDFNLNTNIDDEYDDSAETSDDEDVVSDSFAIDDETKNNDVIDANNGSLSLVDMQQYDDKQFNNEVKKIEDESDDADDAINVLEKIKTDEKFYLNQQKLMKKFYLNQQKLMKKFYLNQQNTLIIKKLKIF